MNETWVLFQPHAIYMWFPSSQVVKDKLGFVGVTERDILPIYHKRFLSSVQHQLFWWNKILWKEQVNGPGAKELVVANVMLKTAAWFEIVICNIFS